MADMASIPEPQRSHHERTAGGPALNVSVLKHGGAMRALEQEWRSIVGSGTAAVPFLQPEWVGATASSFWPKHSPLLITTRREGRLASVLPLVRSTRLMSRLPAKTLRGITSPHACRSDLITAAADRQPAAAATWESLKDDRWWSALVLDDVTEGAAFHEVMELAKRDGFPTLRWRTRLSPYLDLPPGADPFATCPKRYRSFRNRLKGKLDKLRAHGTVEFVTENNPPNKAIKSFFTLESSGWKGAQRSAIAHHPAALHFYEMATAEAARHGYLKVLSLVLDGRPIATQLGLFMSGIYYTPKVAYDERFRDFSPGHLLMQYAIQDITRLGATRFEFLGPNALWKSVWSTSLQRHDTCYIFRPSLRGRTAHAAVGKVALSLRAIRHKLWGDPQDLGHSKN